MLGYGFRAFTATIFDRWGQPIASFSHTSPGWDGRVKDSPAPNGTYAYLIEAITIKGQKELISGNVELVR